MTKMLKQVIAAVEDISQNHQHEAYEGIIDQTYNDLYYQSLSILENGGSKLSSLLQKFRNDVTGHFSSDGISNLISLLKTAEMILESDDHTGDYFWQLLHPRVTALAKSRFDNGFYADAVVSCLREANSVIKVYVKKITGRELDGAALMTTAFSLQNPVITLADLTNENGRNIQLGYMKIFEGAMIGVRNPKSHENMTPNKTITIHLLFQASFLFVKLEETGVI